MQIKDVPICPNIFSQRSQGTHVNLLISVFQGLAIETCGGGLYEELSAYAQPEGAEAPWE